MNKIFLLVFALFFINFISAVNLAGGECERFSFPNFNNVTFEILSNTSSMEGFEWNQNLSEITYCLPIDFSPQNFSVRWFNEQDEVIESSSSESGGGNPSAPLYISSEKISEGITRVLGLNQKIYFVIQENHQLQIKEITTDSATIEIRSDPIEITLKEGETKEFYLDDKILLVYLEDVVPNSYAKISLKTIETTKQGGAGATKQEEEGQESESPQEPTPEKFKDPLFWLILLIMLVTFVLGVIIVNYLLSKREKSMKGGNKEDE